MSISAQESVHRRFGDWSVEYTQDLMTDRKSNPVLTTEPVVGSRAYLEIRCTTSGPSLGLVFDSLWGDEDPGVATVILRFDNSQPSASTNWTRAAMTTRAEYANEMREVEKELEEARRLNSRPLLQLVRMKQDLVAIRKFTTFRPPDTRALLRTMRAGSRVAIEIDAGATYKDRFLFSLAGVSAALNGGGAQCR
jgi:hypothetical protein